MPESPTAIHDQAKEENKAQKSTPTETPNEILKVGFVGLGAMGQGMATSLVKAGFNVCGYDVYAPSVDKFLTVGGTSTAAGSPAEAAADAQVFILMVQNASQVDEVLFGKAKAADSLPNGAVVILNSTVPPSFVRKLRKRLIGMGRNIDLVDAPVSGGVARAAKGQLTVSGSDRLINTFLY
jgi:3-hydroxyisobutyrate dehydrogenase-like beta-hydroxyacid dehydrogenase